MLQLDFERVTAALDRAAQCRRFGSISALSRHLRRFVHCAGRGVPVLTATASARRSILSTGTPIPAQMDTPYSAPILAFMLQLDLSVLQRRWIALRSVDGGGVPGLGFFALLPWSW